MKINLDDIEVDMSFENLKEWYNCCFDCTKYRGSCVHRCNLIRKEAKKNGYKSIQEPLLKQALIEIEKNNQMNYILPFSTNGHDLSNVKDNGGCSVWKDDTKAEIILKELPKGEGKFTIKRGLG